MTMLVAPVWETQRTDESSSVEDALRAVGFAQVDAYRYNAASIRVRVIDARFAGLLHSARVDLIDPSLERLPERTQGDIITVFLFTPDELTGDGRSLELLANAEFDDPSPSML